MASASGSVTKSGAREPDTDALVEGDTDGDAGSEFEGVTEAGMDRDGVTEAGRDFVGVTAGVRDRVCVVVKPRVADGLGDGDTLASQDSNVTLPGRPPVL